MKISVGKLVSGAVWTVGTFGIGQVLRLATNVILARLLAPDVFGLMLIVYTLRTGIELISDVGIGQNVIYSGNAYEPEFYNTAWSVQILRSVVISLIFVLVAIPVARFYNSGDLALILPIFSVTIIIGGLTSIGPAILQKRLLFARLNIFNLFTTAISSVFIVIFAYLNPTVWALVYGGIASSAVTTIGSYLVLPEIKHKFYLDRKFFWEIIHFGKWIFISSIVYFLSGNFDRLYLAKVVPLEILGIYGIARNISELLGNVAVRLGSSVIFPFIASHGGIPRETLRHQLGSIRAKFLLLVASGCSLFIATADLAINLLYDERYRDAAWMLPVLVIGAWFSMVVTINESTLLGLGRPSYGAIGNSIRFIFLVIGLPLSLRFKGLVGGVTALALIEAIRYAPIFIGQRRERFSFGAQDLSMTLAMFGMIGFWEWIRWSAGFGTSFDSFFDAWKQ